ncbi:hypothetical protein ACLFMI_05975 [Pseudonocardia nantongensis]
MVRSGRSRRSVQWRAGREEGDQVKSNLKQAGEKIKDAFKKDS